MSDTTFRAQVWEANRHYKNIYVNCLEMLSRALNDGATVLEVKFVSPNPPAADCMDTFSCCVHRPLTTGAEDQGDV